MTTTENTAIDSAVVVAEAGDPAQPSSPEAAAVTPAAEDSAEDSADDPTKKENLRELREKAMAQYDSMAEDPKRLQRLNFLLEKSTAYVSFVAAKLESNRQDKKKTNKRKAPVSDAKQDTKTKKSKKKRGKRLEIAATADNGDAGSKKGDEEEEAEEEEEQRTISGEVVSERQPKLITGGIMREYQLEGMEWMASL
ncbi:putative ATPase, partial [Linderina macrospora]